MKTTQIKYVGAKSDGETAFGELTGGIVWLPGSTHPIDNQVAGRLLQHPDVFARDEDTASAVGGQIGLGRGQQPAAATTEAAAPMTANAAAFGASDSTVKETQTGNTNVDGMALAPGGTVSEAPAGSPPPAPAAAKPAAKTAPAKKTAKKGGK